MEILPNSIIKSNCASRIGICFGLNREHRNNMTHRSELAYSNPANSMRWRLRNQKIGILFLNGLKLLEKSIVFCIRDSRSV